MSPAVRQHCRFPEGLEARNICFLKDLGSARTVRHGAGLQSLWSIPAGTWPVGPGCYEAGPVALKRRQKYTPTGHLSRVEVFRDFQTRASVLVDKRKVLQILVNLISNAQQAVDEVPDHAKQITLPASGCTIAMLSTTSLLFRGLRWVWEYFVSTFHREVRFNLKILLGIKRVRENKDHRVT